MSTSFLKEKKIDDVLPFRDKKVFPLPGVRSLVLSLLDYTAHPYILSSFFVFESYLQSITTMKKTLLATGAAFAAIALTTMAFAGVRNDPPSKADFSVLKTAIENNDYSSLSDTLKAKITEAQFAKAVEKNSQKDTVESAIEAGDYAAFRNAKIAEIPTEAEFQTMVALHKAHNTAQTAIESAIKNNDFSAFKKAHIELQSTMTTLKSDRPGFEAKTLDDTQLQKRFETLVAKYKADGTLPSAGDKGGMMGIMKWDMNWEGGEHIWKGGNHGNGKQK